MTDLLILNKAIDPVILDQLISHIVKKFVTSGSELCIHAGRIIFDHTIVKTLTRIWCKNESIIESSSVHHQKYINCTRKGICRSEKAGLKLCVNLISSEINKHKNVNIQIGESGQIYLTAVIEYILKDLLQSISTEIVTIATLFNTLNSDEMKQYRTLFKNVYIAGFGMIGDLCTFVNKENESVCSD